MIHDSPPVVIRCLAALFDQFGRQLPLAHVLVATCALSNKRFRVLEQDGFQLILELVDASKAHSLVALPAVMSHGSKTVVAD
jgi:hypothetical protein